MTRQLCTFRVGAYLYGLDVLEVQEMIAEQKSTRVPLAPPELRGLINLRGQIVPAIDLRKRLGLPAHSEGTAAEATRPTMNVVVRTPGGAVSFLVDTIGDVVEIDESLSDAVPQTVPAAARSLVKSVYKFDTELLHELSTSGVVEGIVA